MKSLDQYLSQEAPQRNGASPYGVARSVGGPRRKTNNRNSSVKYNNPYLVHSDYLQDDYDCDTDSLMNDDSSMGIQSESDLFQNSTRRSYRLPTDQALLSDIKRRSTLAKQRRSTLQQKRPSRSQSNNNRHDQLLGDIKSQRRSTRVSPVRGSFARSSTMDKNESLLGEIPSSRRSTMQASRRRTTKRPESLEGAMADLLLLGADLSLDEADNYNAEAANGLPDLEPLDVFTDDSSRLMDDSSRHQTHTFRPDESVSLLDIEENDLQALDFKSNDTLPEMPEEEEEVGQDSLNQFWNESVCRWQRNVDFLLKMSVGDHDLNIVGQQK